MSTKDSQIRATAYRHAQSFEEKKAIRNRVTDLVVELFDIPTDPHADPAYPGPSNASLFRQGLSVFQPSDFDDLVCERNIDNRCGYALCPRPNIKLQGGQTVWNGKGGKDFSLVQRAELEKWCSKECGERATFVRAQLSKEPAWNRETSNIDVRLLDEVQQAQEKSNREAAEANALTGSLQNMSLEGGGRLHISGSTVRPISKNDLADQLRELALERGELRVTDAAASPVIEKLNTAAPEAPLLDVEEDMIEGYRPLNSAEDAIHTKNPRYNGSIIQFAEKGESSDEDFSDIADGMHDDPDI